MTSQKDKPISTVILFLLSLMLWIFLYFPIVIGSTMNSGGDLYNESQKRQGILLQIIFGGIALTPSVIGIILGIKRYKDGSTSNTIGIILSILLLIFVIPIMISNIKIL